MLFMSTLLFGQSCDSFLTWARNKNNPSVTRVVYSNLYVACIQKQQNKKLDIIINLLKKK